MTPLCSSQLLQKSSVLCSDSWKKRFLEKNSVKNNTHRFRHCESFSKLLAATGKISETILQIDETFSVVCVWKEEKPVWGTLARLIHWRTSLPFNTRYDMHPFWRTPSIALWITIKYGSVETLRIASPKRPQKEIQVARLFAASTLLDKYLTMHLVLLQVAYEPTLNGIDFSLGRDLIRLLRAYPYLPLQRKHLPKTKRRSRASLCNSPLSICFPAVI